MKKILFIAIITTAMAGCKDNKEPEKPEPVNEFPVITYNSQSEMPIKKYAASYTQIGFESGTIVGRISRYIVVRFQAGWSLDGDHNINVVDKLQNSGLIFINYTKNYSEYELHNNLSGNYLLQSSYIYNDSKIRLYDFTYIVNNLFNSNIVDDFFSSDTLSYSINNGDLIINGRRFKMYDNFEDMIKF
ncbi:MAG: hypothetical protein FWF72_07280 [Paludibacter sp.]|nr:hypothetical protein [Paludibacter sp.]